MVLFLIVFGIATGASLIIVRDLRLVHPLSIGTFIEVMKVEESNCGGIPPFVTIDLISCFGFSA